MTPDNETELWPDEKFTDERQPGRDLKKNSEPDLQLAVYLLGAGCTPSYVKLQAGFDSVRAVQTFAREDATRQAIEELGTERAKRVGKRALVRLEKLLTEDHTDLRATVLAIRTGLEVSGDLKRDHAAPLKSVRELSVPELNRLIESTREELEARITATGQVLGR